MKGVILAGGKGMRLRPLTDDIPKPMLRLLGKPVMEYSIELLKQHNITTIAVMIQYHGEQIRTYFGDGSKWGVQLIYFEDNPPLGTAGSIKAAEYFLDETFVVISGDTLTNIDLQGGMQFHQQKGADLTIFMKEERNPIDFGMIMTNEYGKITRYVEKPAWQEVISYMVNVGIYIVDPSVLKGIHRNCFMDFSRNIIPMMIESNKQVYGYMTRGYWIDVGTFQRYKRAKHDLLMKKTKISILKKRESSSYIVKNRMK
ncbi:nucleotidyltransferase family protein [Priestia taiwanensis]|uniref:Nucleotidyl transferase domain-containing protein n=1 Tax=Priestia taiwanensis TaxID=1347902 RepID=A0A917ES93_9BACI|nr:nucleotidyltransferase family protein [Priestia taiwanensis]MBM7363795.1 NDP-sugar pyrophosphorylase family protein [Priestia taiwanensis]GGE74039.1 hypothetical protein GCM10007140_24910 [Priestia taiwanensis]